MYTLETCLLKEVTIYLLYITKFFASRPVRSDSSQIIKDRFYV